MVLCEAASMSTVRQGESLSLVLIQDSPVPPAGQLNHVPTLYTD